MADYKRTFSKQGAEKNIEAAKKAIKQAEAFLPNSSPRSSKQR